MYDWLVLGVGDLDIVGFVKMIKDVGVDFKVIGVEVIFD